MSTKGTALVPVVLLSVCSSIVASLLPGVWVVSEVFGFTSHPSVVAALSASASAAAIAAGRLRQQTDRTK